MYTESVMSNLNDSNFFLFITDSEYKICLNVCNNFLICFVHSNHKVCVSPYFEYDEIQERNISLF